MEDQEKKPVPNVAKVVKPVKAERKLTKEEQLEIKQAEFEKKQRAERERIQELRKKLKEKEEEKKTDPSIEAVARTDEETSIEETIPEAEIVAYSAKSKREYQRNLCRKYGIKRKDLQNAIEEAKKMFVARLTVNYNSKIVVAIVDLLEFGDI